MKKINELFECEYDFNIKGITDDSRNVKEGYIFVATKGYNVDHFDYIDDAIRNGCVFLIVDREISIDFPHKVVDNIEYNYRLLCQKFYNIDFSKFHFFGITGTDGKTTTTTIISQLIDDCAYIGTNGVVINDQSFPTSNTTPCISELYSDLEVISKNNISKVSMEVSSEALLHNRIDGFLFDVVGFTNVTGDHLNVHKTFEDYLSCKLKLLNYVKKDGIVLLNGDDPSLSNVTFNNLYTFGFESRNDYVISNVEYLDRGSRFSLRGNNSEYLITSPLIGKYNIYNVTLAFLVGLFYGIDQKILIQRIKKLKPINGRGEFLEFGQKFKIVLDYAHTINGITNILDTFKNYNRIITVTGAAGGREHEKRKIIGKIVIEKSDISIFTMDDPRYEDVNDIIDEMVGDEKDYIRIIDRKDAIKYALDIANEGDVVLILGKGRDNYMAVLDKKIPYNDYDVIKNYFKV